MRINRKLQTQLEMTKSSLDRVQLRYSALKFNYEILNKRFEECDLENRHKTKVLEIVKRENQSSILCVLKILKILQEQNSGMIEKKFKEIVNKKKFKKKTNIFLSQQKFKFFLTYSIRQHLMT